MTETTFRQPRLCYLKSEQLRGPLKTFDHIEVKGRHDENIGRLDGIIIDAAAHRMQYFVVEQGFLHHRRYLLPLAPASVDTGMNVLRMDIDETDLSLCERFDPQTYHRYSDEDVLAAMFRSYHDAPGDLD